MQADRTIPNDTHDVITRDNKSETCLLRDTAIMGDGNMIKKEAEKIVKYRQPQHKYGVR